MDLKLSEQTAVIVGGGRGIGRAIALAFASEGASVAVIDQLEGVGEVAREIESRSGRACAYRVDVTELPDLELTAHDIATMFGNVKHVVFAVGVGSGKFGFPFWNVHPSDWGRVLEINVVGAVNVAHAFVPSLIRNRPGSLLFLSSVAGQIGSQTDPPYSAAKAALINFAQCAARDLAPHDVRVNTLCPGMVQTPLNRAVWEAWNRQQPADQQQSYEEWTADKIRRLVPLNRWQEPEDIAAMAVFLASAQARNITGQTINVDGGYVMHW
jgi:2-hydroxycyclohexanecarboxyl-CoA dehydrogenase